MCSRAVLLGLTTALLFLFLVILPVAAAGSTVPWWDSNTNDPTVWTSRVPITLVEAKGIARSNVPEVLRFSEIYGPGFDYSGINPGSFRVVDPSQAPDQTGETGGNEVPSQYEDADRSGSPSAADILVFTATVRARTSKTYYLYASTDASLTSAPAAISWNLVQNPGFEVGSGTSATGWSPSQNGYQRVSGISHGGTSSIRMSAGSASSSSRASQFIILPVSSSWEEVVVSGWTKAENVGGIRDQQFSIENYDTSGTYGQYALAGTGIHDWELSEATAVPTGFVRRIYVNTLFVHHAGTAYFDDIAVYPRFFRQSFGPAEWSGPTITDPSLLHPYVFGEMVSASVEGVNPTVQSVTCVVKDPGGTVQANYPVYDDGTHGDPTAGDRTWSNSQAFRIGSPVTQGIWKVTCTATSSGGASVSSDGQFRVMQGISVIHPRLYFSAADIPQLRARMQQEPTASYWASIQDTATTIEPFPANADAPDAEWAVIAGLRYPALYYAITGDAAAGARAKARLLQVSAWPSWTVTASVQDNHLVNYDTGKIAIAVGEAYDWLYPLLSDTERATVRSAIVERGVKPAYTDYQNGAYLADARSNRAAQGWGGIGVAALAIMGDDPANPEITPYFPACEAVMEEYLDAFDREGGWPEGVGYQSYGLSDGSGALYYLEAEKRVKGENLYDHPGLSNAAMFPIYLLPPDRLGVSDAFNDASFNDGYGEGAMARLASYYRNGYAQWYLHNAPTMADDVAAFLWYDGSVPATPRDDLPTSKLFPDMGWAVLRTGWGTGDTMLVFRSGPVAWGHNRPEQNSFLLDALGERLVVEPGVSSLTYDDPHMADWYWATVSQNTVLVNGDVHSQPFDVDPGSAAGEVTDFFVTGVYDRIIGSATAAYQGKLTKFIRQIVFVRPDYVVVYDDLAAPGAVKFDNLLHALGTNSIAVSGDEVTITRNSIRLHDTVLFPAGFTSQIRAGRPMLFQGADQPTSYVQLTTPSASTTARFLQVLSPLPAAATPPVVTRVEGTNVLGARIQGTSGSDTLLFSTGTGTVSAEGITMDGQACLVREDSAGVTRFALSQGQSLSLQGVRWYSSDSVSSAAFAIDTAGAGGVVQAGGQTVVHIRSGFPESVIVNSRALGSTEFTYTAADQTVAFPVQSGRNAVVIRQTAPPNRPPVFTPVGDRTVEAGTLLTFTIQATDPDGNDLTYSASGLPAGATFAAGSQTFSWTATSSQQGSYPVTFSASDGLLSDSETVTITVTSSLPPTPPPPSGNHPPVLDPIGEKSVRSGEPLQFTVTASDPDGDSLRFITSKLPQGATFSRTTHVFQWTPSGDQGGKWYIFFTVTDGILSDGERVLIRVT